MPDKKLLSILILAFAAAISAAPIVFYDHSFRSFNGNGNGNDSGNGNGNKHYHLTTPKISDLWDIHNITLQFSDRYYYSHDTSLIDNRWLLHFADSINFHDIDFNFRIRLDGPGYRVRDAGWTSARAGSANDPGFVYDPDRIVAYYTPNERFRFGFGKERYNWGPLELGGLLLSDYNEGFTGFYQQYKLGPFTLRGLSTQLNSMTLDPADRGKITHRYFSAARLEYHKPDYGFAVGQSMLYAGVGRSFELQYLFPFYIFHYGQLTEARGYGNDGQNSHGSIDGYYKIYRLPLVAYGELFIDDFQAHGDSLSASAQNSVAWMAGVRLSGAGRWYGFAEGGRVSTYTYNHKALQERYLHNDNFIGSPLGPDQELLWGKIGRKFFDDTLSVDLNFWLRRSGERGIGYRYANIFHTKNDAQPYGVVEDELSFWAAASYRKFYVDMEVRGGATMYRNRGNDVSGWSPYPFFGIFLSSGVSAAARK